MPDVNPIAILGSLFERYEKEGEKIAQDEFKQSFLGQLDEIKSKLDEIYAAMASISALILSEINRLPLTIVRSEIGGFLGVARDSWTKWHAHRKDAEELFWKGDELFNRLLSAASNAQPSLRYTSVIDLATLAILQYQSSNAAGSLIHNADRQTTFSAYEAFFRDVCGVGLGSLGDRRSVLVMLRDRAIALQQGVAPEQHLNIGSTGSGTFQPLIQENVFREASDQANLGVWRVQAYIAVNGPRNTPPVSRVITDDLLADYLRNPGLLPDWHMISAEHGGHWPDEGAIQAHAARHQDALTLPPALQQILDERLAELAAVASIATQATRLVQKRRLLEAK